MSAIQWYSIRYNDVVSWIQWHSIRDTETQYHGYNDERYNDTMSTYMQHENTSFCLWTVTLRLWRAASSVRNVWSLVESSPRVSITSTVNTWSSLCETSCNIWNNSVFSIWKNLYIYIHNYIYTLCNDKRLFQILIFKAHVLASTISNDGTCMFTMSLS